MTVAERLSIADLSIMADRTRVLLSPEGAQSWYVNDVTRLLEEIESLKSELDEAKQALADDGIEIGSLPVMAAAWKKESSGVYRTKEYKRVKDAINTTRRHNRELQMKLAEVEQALRIVRDAHTSAEIGHQTEINHANGLVEALRSALSAANDQNQSLRQENAKLNEAMVACQERCESVVTMQRAQFDQERQYTMETLRGIMARIEGG